MHARCRLQPVILSMNTYQFGMSEHIRNVNVQSRALLWCRSGRGEVHAGKLKAEIEANSLLLLPWDHDVAYTADARDPFALSAIHLSPRTDVRDGVEYRVAHGRLDPLYGVAGRGDSANLPHDAMDISSRRSAPAIRDLAGVLFHVNSLGPGETARRDELARPLISLLSDAAEEPSGDDATGHLLAERMQVFVRSHLRMRLSLDEIAAVGACSRSTAERVFRRVTGVPTMTWVRQERVRVAMDLLRGTNLNVAEVAARVGFEDPLHFSRTFRSMTNLSPTQFRDRRML